MPIKQAWFFEGDTGMDKTLEKMKEQLAKDAAAAEARCADIRKENTFTIMGHTICLIPDEEQINAAFKKARETVLTDQSVKKLEL